MESSGNSSSSIPGYSEDNFVSYTEDEEESCGQYEDSFETYYSTVSEPSESTWQSSSQAEEEQELEELDPPEPGRDLIRKWITFLKDNQTNTLLMERPHDDKTLTDFPEASEEAQGALRSFCAVKINQLSHLPNSIQPKKNKRNSQRQGSASKKPFPCERNCIIPDQLVNRLHLQNIQETMKQLAEAEMHQPSQCPHCQKAEAKLAEDAFLRRKKTLMENVLLEEKLEELIYTKDSLTLIGEIHKNFPKLSDDPRDIWQKLNKSGLKA